MDGPPAHALGSVDTGRFAGLRHRTVTDPSPPAAVQLTARVARARPRAQSRGRLVRLTVGKDVADATFVLGNRRRVKCDAPGIGARALFRVRKGKIVARAQVAVT
ncbi:MAG: hypothetical protein ACM3QU_10975 [Verrucomicrobiota bacterium]